MKISKSVRGTVSTIAIGFVMAGTGTRAAAAADSEVAICLEKAVDPPVVSQAQAIAAQMFSRIGVKTKWYAYHSFCPVRRYPIMILITSHTPESRLPGALATSRPFEGVHIEVFYERVQRTMDNKRNVPHLLAHVLVHEITHVLQGTDQHSDSGIMKARWDSEDYRQMPRSSLGFTEAACNCCARECSDGE